MTPTNINPLAIEREDGMTFWQALQGGTMTDAMLGRDPFEGDGRGAEDDEEGVGHCASCEYGFMQRKTDESGRPYLVCDCCDATSEDDDTREWLDEEGE